MTDADKSLAHSTKSSNTGIKSVTGWISWHIPHSRYLRQPPTTRTRRCSFRSVGNWHTFSFMYLTWPPDTDIHFVFKSFVSSISRIILRPIIAERDALGKIDQSSKLVELEISLILVFNSVFSDDNLLYMELFSLRSFVIVVFALRIVSIFFVNDFNEFSSSLIVCSIEFIFDGILRQVMRGYTPGRYSSRALMQTVWNHVAQRQHRILSLPLCSRPCTQASKQRTLKVADVISWDVWLFSSMVSWVCLWWRVLVMLLGMFFTPFGPRDKSRGIISSCLIPPPWGNRVPQYQTSQKVKESQNILQGNTIKIRYMHFSLECSSHRKLLGRSKQ